MKLNQAQRRIVSEHQAFHILRSFLTVSETGEKALPLLYSSTTTAFAAYVAADTDLNDDMKTAAMLGNRNIPLTGAKLWSRAKDYKSNFINKYQPIKNNTVTPSGTSNDDEIIDLVRKKFWYNKEKETARTKEVDPPMSYEDCPQTYQPVDFYAYRHLHDHVKLQMVGLSNKRTNSDPEAGNEGMVRSKTHSRKVQRQVDKTMKQAARDGKVAASLSSFGTTGSGFEDLMDSKMKATRFNQKFSLAKFCVEQDIEGGKEMIQAMMRDEMAKDSPAIAPNARRTTGTKISTTDLTSDSLSDEDDDSD